MSSMEGAMMLIKPLLSSNVCDQKFQLLLNACDEQQVLSCTLGNENQNVVAVINSNLNQSTKRLVGIQMLKIFLSQCSDDVFIKNSVSWMMQCLKVLVYQEDDGYYVLHQLLLISHRFKELTKSITLNVIPKLLEQLLKNTRSVPALQCLKAILQHYRGPCKSNYASLQNFLLHFLDEEDKALVKHASQCMSFLPALQVIDSVDKLWADALMDLSSSANTIVFELFQNVQEVIPSMLTNLSVGHKLKNLNSQDPTMSCYEVSRRFMNILMFIEGMLLDDLQTEKSIRADILVALANRVLSVNCKMVSRVDSIEHVALVAVLPDIHIAVFNMLKALISCCHGALIKYGPLFCQLVLRTLKWTSQTREHGVERPFRHLREAACTFLENWILRTTGASSVELLSKELITQLLKDVHQQKKIVTLQVQKSNDKPWQLSNPKSNMGPCEAALRVLCALVQTSGSLLSPSLHTSLQEVACSLLMEIRRTAEPKDLPLPYCVASCRLQLYRLLLVLTLHPHSRVPPPTQFALMLFPWGQHDSSLQVAAFCNLSVTCIRQMVHPSQSSHQFPLSCEEMKFTAGLSDHEPVLKENTLNEQNPTEKMEIVIKKPSKKLAGKSTEMPLTKNLGEKVISKAPNSKTQIKRKFKSKDCEIVNGFECTSFSQSSLKSKVQSPTLEISQPKKRKKSNSVKPCKNNHLQFTVEELDAKTCKKNSVSNNDQGWVVADCKKQEEKATKQKKKVSRPVEMVQTPVGKKRAKQAPDSAVKNKCRKVGCASSAEDNFVSNSQVHVNENTYKSTKLFQEFFKTSGSYPPVKSSVKHLPPESSSKSFEFSNISSKSSLGESSESDTQKLPFNSNVVCSPSKPVHYVLPKTSASQHSSATGDPKSPVISNVSQSSLEEHVLPTSSKSDIAQSSSIVESSIPQPSKSSLSQTPSSRDPTESRVFQTHSKSSDSQSPIALLSPTNLNVPLSPTKSTVAVSPSKSNVLVAPSISNVPVLPVKSNVLVSPAESSVPASPPKSNVPVSPMKSNVPVSPTKSNVPVSPTKSNVPVSPPKSNVPVSPTKSNVPVSPTKSNVPVSPTSSNVPVSPTESNISLSPVKSSSPLSPTKSSIPLPLTSGVSQSSTKLTDYQSPPKSSKTVLNSTPENITVEESDHTKSSSVNNRALITEVSKELNKMVSPEKEKRNNSEALIEQNVMDVIEGGQEDQEISEIMNTQEQDTCRLKKDFNVNESRGNQISKTNCTNSDKSNVEEAVKESRLDTSRYNLRERGKSPAMWDNANLKETKLDKSKVEAKSNALRTPVKNGASSTSNSDNLSLRSSARKLLPVVEVTISSDSDSEILQKRKSGCRRITRSLAKNHPFELVDIEEVSVSSSQETVISVIKEDDLKEIKDEPNGNVSIDLVDTDEPEDAVLRISDSDEESVDNNDSPDKKSKTNDKEHHIQSNKDNSNHDTDKVKNAVMSKPLSCSDVEVSSNDKIITKKSVDMTEDNLNSESAAEEDILMSFVDVVTKPD